MPGDQNHPYKLIDSFCNLGFTVGVTLKGPWGTSENMYHFIREDIIPPPIRLVVPVQVHGVDIINIDEGINDFAFEADGVMTKRHDLCLSVTTAACLPLIMADTTSGLFAAVHVGWRCFIGGIIENLSRQGIESGMKLDTTHFFIGAGIADCCFEVGSEVAILFDDSFIRRHNGGHYVDLKGALGNKLESLGVDRHNIENHSECTSCRGDLFYSYRRDKDSPIQMVTFIYKST
jgi:polyphenol oxidase